MDYEKLLAGIDIVEIFRGMDWKVVIPVVLGGVGILAGGLRGDEMKDTEHERKTRCEDW